MNCLLLSVVAAFFICAPVPKVRADTLACNAILSCSAKYRLDEWNIPRNVDKLMSLAQRYGQNIHMFCMIARVLKRCHAENKQHCHDPTVFHTISLPMKFCDYLCSTEVKTMLRGMRRNSICMENSTVVALAQRGLNECEDDYQYALYKTHGDEYCVNLCPYLEELSNCVNSALANFCHTNLGLIAKNLYDISAAHKGCHPPPFKQDHKAQNSTVNVSIRCDIIERCRRHKPDIYYEYMYDIRDMSKRRNLESICEKYSDYDLCYKENYVECNDAKKLKEMLDQLKIYQYMCSEERNEGYRLIYYFSPCTHDETDLFKAQEGVDNCDSGSVFLRRDALSASQNAKCTNLCPILEQQHKCVEGAVTHYYGNEFGSFVRHLYDFVAIIKGCPQKTFPANPEKFADSQCLDGMSGFQWMRDNIASCDKMYPRPEVSSSSAWCQYIDDQRDCLLREVSGYCAPDFAYASLEIWGNVYAPFERQYQCELQRNISNLQ